MTKAPPPMVCERCQAAEAVVHLTQFREGIGVLHHYCVECARAIGATVTVVTSSQETS